MNPTYDRNALWVALIRVAYITFISAALCAPIMEYLRIALPGVIREIPDSADPLRASKLLRLADEQLDPKSAKQLHVARAVHLLMTACNNSEQLSSNTARHVETIDFHQREVQRLAGPIFPDSLIKISVLGALSVTGTIWASRVPIYEQALSRDAAWAALKDRLLSDARDDTAQVKMHHKGSHRDRQKMPATRGTVTHERTVGHATTAPPQEMTAGRATTSPVPPSPTNLRCECDSARLQRLKQLLATLAAPTPAVRLHRADVTRTMPDRAARSLPTIIALKTGDRILTSPSAPHAMMPGDRTSAARSCAEPSWLAHLKHSRALADIPRVRGQCL